MNATTLYRTAAGLFVLFALGHTVGFLRFTPPTAEGIAVRDAMQSVHFSVGNATFSYGGFYKGFGLYVTAYLVFSVLLAWHLGGLANAAPRAIGTLGWAFFAVQAAGLVLSAMYFSAAPAIFSGVIAALLGTAAWMAGRIA